ncbi:MAG: Uma2 family endonuclease [Rubrobacter sp.]|nr:Uma2 family endonuclease [Rubrobacter sp.]MBA3951252.1 Uma2 family endonuclease [Rubrobacter sp.]
MEVAVEVVKSPAEQRMLLENASWGTYERLIAEREERRTPRFFYDRGVLELMSPSSEHDRISRIIAALIELLAEETGLDVDNAGSTTFKREDLERGFEPDECFYFSDNAGRIRELVRDKGNVDLDAGDPPPDLVVEVDITNPSLNKLPIYASLGVSEVWRHDGERLVILRLRDSEGYTEAAESGFLPAATTETLTRLVLSGLTLDRRTWREEVRDSVSGPENRPD